VDPITGKRQTRRVTVRGTKKDAERGLRSILYRQDKGIGVDPSKIAVAEFLDDWFDKKALQRVAPKSLERYRGLVRNQIKPHLGAILLQKLRPADVNGWMQTLIGSENFRHAVFATLTAS